MGDATYTIDARGTATAAAAIKELKGPCDAIERELAGITLPPGQLSLAAAVSDFAAVCQDATSALGDSLIFLGDQVFVATVTYAQSEADSSAGYTRPRPRREAI